MFFQQAYFFYKDILGTLSNKFFFKTSVSRTSNFLEENRQFVERDGNNVRGGHKLSIKVIDQISLDIRVRMS